MKSKSSERIRDLRMKIKGRNRRKRNMKSYAKRSRKIRKKTTDWKGKFRTSESTRTISN